MGKKICGLCAVERKRKASDEKRAQRLSLAKKQKRKSGEEGTSIPARTQHGEAHVLRFRSKLRASLVVEHTARTHTCCCCCYNTTHTRRERDTERKRERRRRATAIIFFWDFFSRDKTHLTKRFWFSWEHNMDRVGSSSSLAAPGGGSPVCRICWCSICESNGSAEFLRPTPCSCRDERANVHQACLE